MNEVESDLLTLLSNPEEYKKKLQEFADAEQAAQTATDELRSQKLEIAALKAEADNAVAVSKQMKDEAEAIRISTSHFKAELDNKEQWLAKSWDDLNDKTTDLEQREKAYQDNIKVVEAKLASATAMEQNGLQLKNQYETKLNKLKSFMNDN